MNGTGFATGPELIMTKVRFEEVITPRLRYKVAQDNEVQNIDLQSPVLSAEPHKHRAGPAVLWTEVAWQEAERQWTYQLKLAPAKILIPISRN